MHHERSRILSGAVGLIADVSRDLFFVSFITYLVLVMLEKVWHGYVSLFFDAAILLYFVVPTWFIYALTLRYSRPESMKRGESHLWTGTTFAFMTGVVVALLVHAATVGERLSAVGSICGGMIAALLAWTIPFSGGSGLRECGKGKE